MINADMDDLLLAPLGVSPLVARVPASVELRLAQSRRVWAAGEEQVAGLLADAPVENQDGIVVLDPAFAQRWIICKIRVGDGANDGGGTQTLAVQIAWC